VRNHPLRIERRIERGLGGLTRSFLLYPAKIRLILSSVFYSAVGASRGLCAMHAAVRLFGTKRAGDGDKLFCRDLAGQLLCGILLTMGLDAC